LGSVFMHLKAEVNWYRMFHNLIDGFDEATLAARQQTALAAAGVPGTPRETQATSKFSSSVIARPLPNRS
jgi:hypothetical protein